VIVFPSWNDKFMSFDQLKEKARKLINLVLLRTVGVIFSDDEDRTIQYIK